MMRAWTERYGGRPAGSSDEQGGSYSRGSRGSLVLITASPAATQHAAASRRVRRGTGTGCGGKWEEAKRSHLRNVQITVVQGRISNSSPGTAPPARPSPRARPTPVCTPDSELVPANRSRAQRGSASRFLLGIAYFQKDGFKISDKAAQNICKFLIAR